jgi:hypothetical protein
MGHPGCIFVSDLVMGRRARAYRRLDVATWDWMRSYRLRGCSICPKPAHIWDTESREDNRIEMYYKWQVRGGGGGQQWGKRKFP